MKNKFMGETKKVFIESGGRIFLGNHTKPIESIANKIYILRFSQEMGFYIEPVQETFTFDYKIYGLETRIIDRVLNHYNNTDKGNLGVLLNGLKGTGKTVTSKILCNKLKQPVVLIANYVPGCTEFINAIPQNITVFIDEYEKVFAEKSDMLTIMDGSLNSKFRRVFILTTNHLRVDENLIQRPSRIRYLKSFADLSPEIVTEIVDDNLVHTHHKDELLSYIMGLELITVDIVKTIIEEVNIHDEGPSAFRDIFNAKALTDKFTVSIVNDEGTVTEEIGDNVKVYPRPTFTSSHTNGYWLDVEGKTIGKITDVLASNVIEVSKFVDDDDDNEPYSVLKVMVDNAYTLHANYAWGMGGGLKSTKVMNAKSNFFEKRETPEEAAAK